MTDHVKISLKMTLMINKAITENDKTITSSIKTFMSSNKNTQINAKIGIIVRIL